MKTRKTALQSVHLRSHGGSYYDSFTLSRMFRDYKPHNFGLKVSQLFTSELGEHLVNKKFTYYTAASGNVHYLPGGTTDYEWNVSGAAQIDARITELLVAPGSQPGRNKGEFQIALDRGWFHEPVVLKTEQPDLPMMRIIGHPVQKSANSWIYNVKLQTGDVNDFMDIKYIMPERTVVDGTTMVSNEMNTKYGGDQFGQMFKLRSHIGNYGRKVEVTDRAIRVELAARKSGNIGALDMDKSVGVGYVFQQGLKDKTTKKKYSRGVFISMAEARLLERVEYDREFAMEFGKLQTTYDEDSKYPVKAAPGWRQLVRDGHYLPHNGSLTLSDIYEYIMSIFITRKDFTNRVIKLCSGEAGIEFMNRLLAQEAGRYFTLDTNFINKRTDGGSGYHKNELEYGAQFTKWLAPNGLTIELVYDPCKDDRRWYPILAPGTNRTVESFCYDIFDFGNTDQKGSGARNENITMVMEQAAEEYYWVHNIYNPYTGAIQDGSNAYGNSKEAGCYRAINGSLCIWDITRVGRIEFSADFCGSSC